ncbi:MAG: potassium channel family protein [Candidatus Eisenbacteria bacterium]
MAQRAVGLLLGMGYRQVREYLGGLEEWDRAGLPFEHGAAGGATVFATPITITRGASSSAPPRAARRVSMLLGEASFRRLFALWLSVVMGSAFLYYLGPLVGLAGLHEQGHAVAADLRGLGTAIYFSFVTATSIGFGDVVPVGIMRVIAVAEGAAGLLVFGIVVSKLVSGRQEMLTEEIHRTTFEERLGRVRTNLHLVLSELQALGEDCDRSHATHEQMARRVESAAMIFSSELGAVHDLLYRPQQTPDESVLEALLANLAASLRELTDLVARMPEVRDGSPILRKSLGSIERLSGEICGECVPRQYAPELKVWMDQIQDLSHRLH